ncbi:MAG: carboxylating nicotinate-nucleotide diphosphorylase [Candidatus Bathyarchaeota archaeon]|nr:MAG: carboxylating nicotinate-nucleotide diphosphorylase [Candidatus Bathyarchaeota archaeon]
MYLPRKILEEKLQELLGEDIGHGDITSSLTISENLVVEAEIVAKERCIVAGLEEATILCEDLNLTVTAHTDDGSQANAEARLLRIVGDPRTILSAERTLLNLLSRMSGIATITNHLVSKIRSAGYETRVAATRKVAPGLSYFDKKAVLLGGGDTHRICLDDLILIKDNHVKITGSIHEAVRRVRENASFSKKIEIEVRSLDEALKAAEANVDIIMLDNFSPGKVKEAVAILKNERVAERVLLEASGGITENNVVEYAASGVDIISLGRITQSPKAIDMSLEVVKVNKTRT